MKRLNSKFTDSQYKLISSTQKKFRLYYAIMLKYYESHYVTTVLTAADMLNDRITMI